MYKLRKRNSGMMHMVPSDVEERLDIHRQRMTKALLYLLVLSCEVHHPRQLAGRAHADKTAYERAVRIVSQDIPYSVLTILYILETDKPPSAIVLLSFATSLIYLGCASLIICCTSREHAVNRGPSADSESA